MKRIYVNESWCLGCHLCEYYCAFANTGKDDMRQGTKGVGIHPRIQVEDSDSVHFAVSPAGTVMNPCASKSCITGALHLEDGVIRFDDGKCVGCYTRIPACPYGAVMPSADGIIQK